MSTRQMSTVRRLAPSPESAWWGRVRFVLGMAQKVLAWYDNEISYVHRMIELAHRVGTAFGAAA